MKPSEKNESPTVVAARLGLGWRRGPSCQTLTWEHVLDLACMAYWQRRNERQAA